jgi:hypothetical protein
MPWDESRLEAVEQSAASCPDACAADVRSLVAEVRRLREAGDAAMVWAIDLVPRARDYKVWRCRGCSQRGEYPAKIQHGPACPFGKIDAVLDYQNTVSRMFVGPEAER